MTDIRVCDTLCPHGINLMYRSCLKGEEDNLQACYDAGGARSKAQEKRLLNTLLGDTHGTNH